jgi:bifunctional non-homologous end joining protein LigD
MMAQTADDPFDNEDWLFEIKFDGYRAIAEVDKGEVKLYSRNGLGFEAAYPEVYNALKQLKLKAIFDGEIVAMDSDNRSSFKLMQKAGKDPNIGLYYYIFDLLSLEGKDMQSLPLLERKAQISTLIKGNDILRYSDHVLADGKDFFQLVIEHDLEGMIAKRIESIYHQGIRSRDWLKIKHQHNQEAIIVGFTPPQGGRKFFGALVLAVYDKKELMYVGNVGTGFDEQTLKDLHTLMLSLKTDNSPFSHKIPGDAHITWIKPQLVANIRFTEWTSDGAMRHPVYLGLRNDKSAAEVVKE